MDIEKPLNLKKYMYSNDDRPTDQDGFPIPKEELSGVDLQKELPISVPSKSFQLFTEIDI